MGFSHWQKNMIHFRTLFPVMAWLIQFCTCFWIFHETNWKCQNILEFYLRLKINRRTIGSCHARWSIGRWQERSAGRFLSVGPFVPRGNFLNYAIRILLISVNEKSGGKKAGTVCLSLDNWLVLKATEGPDINMFMSVFIALFWVTMTIIDCGGAASVYKITGKTVT